MLAAATVHFPYMTGWPERASAEHRAATTAGFAQLGKAFADAGIGEGLAQLREAGRRRGAVFGRRALRPAGHIGEVNGGGGQHDEFA